MLSNKHFLSYKSQKPFEVYLKDEAPMLFNELKSPRFQLITQINPGEDHRQSVLDCNWSYDTKRVSFHLLPRFASISPSSHSSVKGMAWDAWSRIQSKPRSTRKSYPFSLIVATPLTPLCFMISLLPNICLPVDAKSSRKSRSLVIRLWFSITSSRILHCQTTQSIGQSIIDTSINNKIPPSKKNMKFM